MSRRHVSCTSLAGAESPAWSIGAEGGLIEGGTRGGAKAEDEANPVECGTCAIAPACELTGMLDQALAAFRAAPDRYALSDLLKRPAKPMKLLVVGAS